MDPAIHSHCRGQPPTVYGQLDMETFTGMSTARSLLDLASSVYFTNKMSLARTGQTIFS